MADQDTVRPGRLNENFKAFWFIYREGDVYVGRIGPDSSFKGSKLTINALSPIARVQSYDKDVAGAPANWRTLAIVRGTETYEFDDCRLVTAETDQTRTVYGSRSGRIILLTRLAKDLELVESLLAEQ